MAAAEKSIDLDQYGIVGNPEIIYNADYDQLFSDELASNLEGYEKGVNTEFGAVKVDTGRFTGRSPKDKFILLDDTTRDTVWWRSDKAKSSDNKPISQEIWEHGYKLAVNELSYKKVYVMDVYCGANKSSRLKVRFIVEVAWQAHFVKNMFIRPTEEELDGFEPDFVMLNAAKATNPNWEEQNLHSEVFVFFNMTEGLGVIGGSWYGGEMKKGIFSVMNYYLPLRGIAAMHCSANVGNKGDTAIFLGCLVLEKRLYQQIQTEHLLAMMNMDGMMMVFLISKEAVMLKQFISVKKMSPIFIMQLKKMLYLKM